MKLIPLALYRLFRMFGNKPFNGNPSIRPDKKEGVFPSFKHTPPGPVIPPDLNNPANEIRFQTQNGDTYRRKITPPTPEEILAQFTNQAQARDWYKHNATFRATVLSIANGNNVYDTLADLMGIIQSQQQSMMNMAANSIFTTVKPKE